MPESQSESKTTEKKLKTGSLAIYETQWVANDPSKEYPHGWGFTPPIIEMPRDIDPAYVGKLCREQLSNDEFSCIGAIPKPSLNGLGLLDYPRL